MTRRERLERKVERRRQWAQDRERDGWTAHERFHSVADGIPLGQPGVSHADIKRMDYAMRSAVNGWGMAKYHEQKAEGLERQLRHTIYSDDGDAVGRLEAKIAKLEAEREAYKARGRGALPAYVLRNLGAEIRRNRQRLEEIKQQQTDQAAGVRSGGRVMLSRYAGTCADCGQPIEKRQPITWYRSTREAVHVECPRVNV
jgi:hypothetical protein